MPLVTTASIRQRLRHAAFAAALGGSVLAVGVAAVAPPASASPAVAAKAKAKAKTVTATMTEWNIALSAKSFAPGKYTFVAKNAGQFTHALEINGPGVNGKSTADISAGQSADLTVTLKKGTYDVFCPVPGHKAKGMDLSLVVKAHGGSAASASSSGGAGF
jgi:uncharacterized cupredoxin-like copper-binding protein